MTQNRAKVAIDLGVRLKSLKRALITRRALQEKAFASYGLLDDTLHRPRIIRSDEPIWRAHDGRMAGVVNQSRQRFAVERIESDREHFMVAGPIWIDAEKTFACWCDGAPIGINMALATTSPESHGL